MTQEERYKERKKWFVDRIGKTVYRSDNFCDCRVCKNVYENGVEIQNENHAINMMDCEGESKKEDEKGFRYFDTKEEAEQFEKTL